MVVFVKYYAMEHDDGRRGKRGGLFRRMFGSSVWSTASSDSRQSNLSLGPTSPPRERRPLRSVPTIGPQYKVDPEVLAKEYVEKETKYMGTIADVRQDFDPGNRSLLLSLIDEKRKVGQLPWQMTWQNDVVMSFSVYNIKILWRDGEQLIHRIPTHQVAAAGYVQDDNQTFLFFKFASEVNEQMCNLAIFCCESKILAHEVCCLTQQLFQLSYTESTMDFFDKSIQDGAITPKNHSYSTDDSSEKKDTVQLTLPIKPPVSKNHSIEFTRLSNGRNDANDLKEFPVAKASTLPFTSAPSSILHSDSMHSSNGGVSSPLSSSSTPSSPVSARRPWRSGSSSGSTFTSHQLQLKEYIEVLKERLSPEELGLFAQHLHFFRTSSVPIKVFCDQLMGIYTEQRKSLLLGMRHFIPGTRDRAYFETFLKENNVETSPDDTRWWDRAPNSRTISEADDSNTSTAIHITELSSNSDRVSTSPASNEDSGEWCSMLGDIDTIKISEDSSTLTRQSDEEQPYVTLFEPTRGSPQSPPSSPTDVPNVVLSLEEGDSPLLRSGEDKEEVDPPIFIHHRSEEKQHKTKKSRGKSPSAAELGAPYPTMATGGTNDDLDKKQEMKIKRGSKVKYKRNNLALHSGSEEKIKSSEIKGETSTPGSSQDLKDEIPSDSSSRPRKQEHRKKKKHKNIKSGGITIL